MADRGGHRGGQCPPRPFLLCGVRLVRTFCAPPQRGSQLFAEPVTIDKQNGSCRNLTLVWFAFGGGRGPPGLLINPTCLVAPFSGTVLLLFRAIHLTIFWGTDGGHVGQCTDARTGHRRRSPVCEQQRQRTLLTQRDRFAQATDAARVPDVTLK